MQPSILCVGGVCVSMMCTDGCVGACMHDVHLCKCDVQYDILLFLFLNLLFRSHQTKHRPFTVSLVLAYAHLFCFCLTAYLFVCISICISAAASVCLCMSVCMSVFLSLSLSHTHTHTHTHILHFLPHWHTRTHTAQHNTTQPT